MNQPDLSELSRLFAQQRVTEELARPAREGAEASDPSGSVTVSLTADGALERITVIPRWQDKLDRSVDRLEQAVRLAAANALNSQWGFEPATEADAAKDWSQVALAPAELPEPQVTEADETQAQRAVAAQYDMIEQAAATQSPERAVADFEELLQRLLAIPVGGPDAAGRTLTSENGHLSIELALTGSLVGLSIDAHWGASQSGTTLTMVFDDLFGQLSEPQH